MSNITIPALFFTALVITYPDNTEIVNITIPNEVVAVTIEYRTHSTKHTIPESITDVELEKIQQSWNEEDHFTRKIYFTKIKSFKTEQCDEEGICNEKIENGPVTVYIIPCRRTYEIKRIWLWLKNGQKIQGINLGSASPTLPPLNTLPN